MSNVSLVNGHIDRTKMTDEQIVKALECCKSFDDLRACYKCPALENGDCSNGKVYISDFILDNALDLINRQKAEIEKLENIERIATKTIETQSAEIERLQKENEGFKCVRFFAARGNNKSVISHFINYNTGLEDGTKEFAERLKSQYVDFDNNVGAIDKMSLYKDIDNLVKELVGDEK